MSCFQQKYLCSKIFKATLILLVGVDDEFLWSGRVLRCGKHDVIRLGKLISNKQRMIDTPKTGKTGNLGRDKRTAYIQNGYVHF